MNTLARTQNSKRNVFNGIINFSITSFLHFLVRTIFIRTLSVDILGINGLYVNILQVLSLGELGLSNIALHTMYKPLQKHDKKEISRMVTFYSRIYNIIAVAIFAIGLAVIPFLPAIANSNLPMHSLIGYYILFLLNTSISYIGISKQLLINADQNIRVIKNATTLITVVQSIAQIVLLQVTRSYYLYLIIQCVCTAALNFYLARRAKRMYKFINKQEGLSKKKRRSIIRMTKDLFIYKVSVVIVNSTDNILISVLLGAVVVGYYSNYVMVFSIVANLLYLIIQSVSSSIGHLAAEASNQKKLAVFYKILFIMQWIVTVASVCLLALLNDTIRIWAGESFVLSQLVVVAIVTNFYTSNVINPVWMYREAMGLYGAVKWTMAVTAALNIVLSCILGLAIGLSGILFATAISRILTTVWYEPTILLKKNLGDSVGKYYRTQLKNLIIFLVIAILVCQVSAIFIPNNFMTLLAKAVLVFLGASLLYVIFQNGQTRTVLKWLRS